MIVVAVPSSLKARTPSARPRPPRRRARPGSVPLSGRETFLEVSRRLGIHTENSDNWYKVTIPDFLRHGGNRLLKYSLVPFLQSAFPRVWDVARLPNWKNQYIWPFPENQRAFLLFVGEKLGIMEGDWEAWYQLKPKDIRLLGGDALLELFKYNIHALLSSAFPEFKWNLNRVGMKSKLYWASVENIRDFMENHLGPKLGLSKGDFEAWARVPMSTILTEGSQTIGLFYETRFKFLSSVFPEHDWRPLFFNELAGASSTSFEELLESEFFSHHDEPFPFQDSSFTPKNLPLEFEDFGNLRSAERDPFNPSILYKGSDWKDPKTVRASLERMGEALGIKNSDFGGWYNISIEDLVFVGGLSLLETYEFRLLSILSLAFPEHKWDPHAFVSRPPFIHTLKLREKLVALWKTLSIEENGFEAWYEVPYKTYQDHGLESILAGQFNGSRFAMLSAAFPNHIWHPWLFKGTRNIVGKNSLTSRENFAKYLEKALGLETLDDWYKIGKGDLMRLGLSAKLVQNESTFLQFLRVLYPHVSWDVDRFRWGSGSGWSKIQSFLEKYFPGEATKLSDFVKNASVGPRLTKPRILVLPKSEAVIEYQGLIDFAEQIVEGRTMLTRFTSGPVQDFAARTGFTPITIPFWWDRKESSLLAEFFQAKKALFEKGCNLEDVLEALGREGIPESVSLKGLQINKGYLKMWFHDPRFRDLFVE